MPPIPFRANVDAAILADLSRRLCATRWPAATGEAQAAYGVDQALLRQLVHHWIEFDWRKAEQAINRYPQFLVEIDGQTIHYLHIRSPVPGATPLILTHGWPWTFWDMRCVFAPLTDPLAHGGTNGDAFELIVPSLPGFAFSTPASPAGSNFWRTAELWHRLMAQVLGFARYGAAGGDWGALVSAQLGHRHADHVEAIHITQPLRLDMFSTGHPWRLPAEDAARSATFERRYASHLAVHMIEPDTLAAGLSDSPAGMLAWLLQRWCGWSGTPGTPALDRDQMLADATIYWACGAIGPSLRFYAEAGRDPWRPAHQRTPCVEAPAGVTLLAPELPEGADPQAVAAKLRADGRAGHLRIVHVGVHDRGGHFAHYENPGAVVADIRATFSAARNCAARHCR